MAYRQLNEVGGNISNNYCILINITYHNKDIFKFRIKNLQLVGYGTDAEHGDFWIVRNSWGPEWGEKGFIRLKRESEAICGTDSTPSMGTACEGDGNAVQKVCGMCGVLFDTTYPIGADTTSGIRP